MRGISGTRAVKNARYLAKAAPHLFPPSEPPFGVPFDVLCSLHLGKTAGANQTLKTFLASTPLPAVLPEISGPLFSGTLHFMQLQFTLQSQGNLIVSLSDTDMATIVNYAQRAAPVISQYASLYGPNTISVDATFYSFIVPSRTVAQGNSYTDQELQNWINQLAQTQGWPSNDAIFAIHPVSVINTLAPQGPTTATYGYHSAANLPYCFAYAYGQNLTIADGTNIGSPEGGSFALGVSHEIAEMVVDPVAPFQNTEVCDPCSNCQPAGAFRHYFDNGRTYLASTQTFPVAFLYDFYINGIAQPGTKPCPMAAPGYACNYPPPALMSVEGKLTLLRVQDLGERYGPVGDILDAEVIVAIDSKPGSAFGFQLREDPNECAHRSLLDTLRDAFAKNATVHLEYVPKTTNNSTLTRVWRVS
jgi:hypothetical protein